MIIRKLDNDTVLKGHIIKISELKDRIKDLKIQQIASQADRDWYDSLDANVKEKTILPIDFTEEINLTQERIDRYKAMKIVN